MLSVTSGVLPVFSISCGSPFSTSSNEPTASSTRFLPDRATPAPDTTYSHCSAHACSFALDSLDASPGASVIIAACDVPVACSTSNASRLLVLKCFMTRSRNVMDDRNQPQRAREDCERNEKVRSHDQCGDGG